MIEIAESLVDAEIKFQYLLEKKFGNKLQNKSIFLKPNMGYPKPSPFTTSVEMVHMVVNVLSRFKPSEITIGEGSTSETSAIENFQKLKVQEKLSEFNVSFVDLNNSKSSSVMLDNGIIHYIPSILKTFDLRISLPVIKFYDDDQGEIFLSNAIKNFFGVLPKNRYQNKPQSYKRDALHRDLHASVAEVFQAVEKFTPFDFYICDGLEILQGEAEVGNPIRWDKILLSDNAIEVDLKVLELLGKPMPRYLKLITGK
ncbi:MAG: DUF362 domain-containing protein [Asgard group archaeon]|nr:DUF362 domain-containing protein [Asgard group archaeon]